MRTNFQMEYQNITMTKGDTVSFNIIVEDADGNPVTLDEIYFTCKKIASDKQIIFQKSLDDGITQDESLVTVRIAPNDTIDAEAGLYYYDCQIGINDDVFTILKGIFTMEQDVTF